MDNIDIKYFIHLVENNECIWKNSTINADNLCEVEAAWRSIAFIIYDNFDDFKENQKRFWVNNLKRKWKTILSKFKTIGSNYEHFRQLHFLVNLKKSNTYLNEKIANPHVNKTDLHCSIKLKASNKAIKCGEILYENFNYFYKCAICDTFFDLLEFFESHMSKKHFLPFLKEMEVDNLKNESVEYLIEEECVDTRTNIKQENYLEKYITEYNSILKAEITGTTGTTEKLIQKGQMKLDTFNNCNFADVSDLRIDNPSDDSNLDQIECEHCCVIFQSTNGHDFDYCFQIQKKISRLNGDLRALRDEGIFHCDRCPRYFSSSDEMYKHRRKKHYQICPVCKIRLLNIENHVISHHNEINFKQLKLPDSFKSGKFECKLCDKILIHKEMWIRHLNRCFHTEIVENKVEITKLG